MESWNKGLVLLDFHPSMFGMRVRVALEEKSLPYTFVEQDLKNKSELLLKANPIHKKIPVFLDDGKPICESAVIVQYIDEKWNQINPILASDPYHRAQERFWVDYIDKNIYQSSMKVWQTKGDEQAEANKVFLGHLKLLEGELGDKAFFGGDKFGFLDLGLIPFSSWFDAWSNAGGFSMEQECPKLMAWVERCRQRESVKKGVVDPSKINEFFSSYKKSLGY